MQNREVAELIYMYIVEDKSIANIASEVGLPVADVSSALTSCGIAGKNNATGESNLKGGEYKGKYSTGIYTLDTPKLDGPDSVNLEIDVLSDYVRRRNKNDTLESYLERVYGGKTVKMKSTGKIAACVICSVVTLSIINPVTLFEWGHSAQVTDVKGDFFGELKGNIQDAVKDSLVGRAIEKIKDVMWEKEVEQIEKENEEYLEYRSREATAELVSLYTLGSTKYVGKKLGENPYMDCFSVSADGNEYVIGNYDENGRLSGMTIKYQFMDSEHWERAFSTAELGTYYNGEFMSGIRAKADLINGIKVGKYDRGNNLEGFIIHKTLDDRLILEKANGEEVGRYQEGEWKDLDGNAIESGTVIDGYEFNMFADISVEGNKVNVFDGLLCLSDNALTCWQQNDTQKNIISVDLMNGKLSYDTKMDDLWSGAKIEWNKRDVTCEFLDEDKRSNTTRTARELLDGKEVKSLTDYQ